MKKIFVAIFIIFGGIFSTMAAFACDSNEIDVAGDGTNCETAKFSVTTTNLASNDEFRFYMSATGTFYVDCGDGGTLSGTGVSGKTVTRTDTSLSLYTCTYSTAGTKTIRFGGLATGYNTGNSIGNYGAIQFGYYSSGNDLSQATPGLITAIDGSLGAIFPTLGSGLFQQPAFTNTFHSVPITTIPEHLFDGIHGCRNLMFFQTFIGSKITSIPNNLFSGITCPANNLFRNAFWGTKITSIPPDLFKNIIYDENLGSDALNQTFWSTFYKCTNLSGYIPPSLFGELNNSGKYGNSMMGGIFYGSTNLATSCPAGTVQFVTGYEDYWDGHVSCVDASFTCDAGTYLPAHGYECTTCPTDSYCTGGNYNYSESQSAGITACAAGLYAPAGMWAANQCGHILHIGDEMVYLHGVKKTSPSLHVKIGNDIFYGNMTTADVVMHTGTAHKLKVQYNNATYSIYDDTVDVSN